MMNYKIFCTLSVIVLYIIPHIYASECPVIQDEEITKKETKTKLFKGQQMFTVDFLDKALKANPDGNLFFSPYSLYRALLLAYIGSENSTEAALVESLQLKWSQDKSEVITAYKQDKLQRLQNAKLETALEFEAVDKFFFDKKVEIKDCMKTMFDEEIELLDIAGDLEGSRNYINNWVEGVTKEQIKDLIPPGAMDESTKLALANAAYFKGLWSSKFDADNTEKELFYKKPDQYTFVDMMKQVGSFNFAANEQLGCHILEIPYNKSNPNSNDLSFVVFLPPFVKENALEDVLSKLTPDTLAQALNEGQTQKVDLKLPKFTLEHEIQLDSVSIFVYSTNNYFLIFYYY